MRQIKEAKYLRVCVRAWRPQFRIKVDSRAKRAKTFRKLSAKVTSCIMERDAAMTLARFRLSRATCRKRTGRVRSPPLVLNCLVFSTRAVLVHTSLSSQWHNKTRQMTLRSSSAAVSATILNRHNNNQILNNSFPTWIHWCMTFFSTYNRPTRTSKNPSPPPRPALPMQSATLANRPNVVRHKSHLSQVNLARYSIRGRNRTNLYISRRVTE